MEIVAQIIINILISAAMYALVTLGFSLVYGVSRVLHLAHSVVITVAGFSLYWFVNGRGMPWGAAMLGAIFAACAVGFVMYVFVYRILKRKRASGLILLLATLALFIVGTQALLALFGPRTFTVSPPFPNVVYSFWGASITATQIVLIATAAVVAVIVASILKWSRFGRSLRAVADNPDVASTCGINVERNELWAFLLASVIGSLAGILIAWEFSLQANMTVMLTVKLFTVGIIGGVGSLPGAIVGSVIIGGLENLTSWFWGSGWQHAASFLLLFLFLLIRPRGIFGAKDL